MAPVTSIGEGLRRDESAPKIFGDDYRYHPRVQTRAIRPGLKQHSGGDHVRP